MNSKRHPVYTEQAECRDCYKCIRECPVKAIKVKDHSANVIDDACIACGHCVNVCSTGAKKVRNDLERAKWLVSSGAKVIVSLAPSWCAEFDGTLPADMIVALKRLGFWGVSETALGAEEVSAHVSSLLEQGETNDIFISSACPVVVDLIRYYYPRQARWVTPVMSPVLAHCKLLRREYGEDIAIVFISPCIAKKREADRHPELLNVAITFEELKTWFAEKCVWPSGTTRSEEVESHFIPRAAVDGRMYPIDGGMTDSVHAVGEALHDVRFMSFSGIRLVQSALENLEQSSFRRKVFLELLSCQGGCINGPKAERRVATVVKREDVLEQTEVGARSIRTGKRSPSISVDETYPPDEKTDSVFSEDQISEALASIGKHTMKDELNCGGCGYDSCRAFASALLSGKAEVPMCVSYMRKMASNQANALMKAMPSGVILVDDKLTVLECNLPFVEIIGGDIKVVHETCPGLRGARLEKAVPFHNLFSHVLENGEPIEKQLRFEGKILKISVFPIEEGRVVGGIVQDITQPVGQREQIVQKTQEVIHKNLTTVQKIAYLLGENAAESEVILNSIIQSFAVDAVTVGDRRR